MTQRQSRSGIPPHPRKPPIAGELETLAKLPPRTRGESLSALERLAVLNGLRYGLTPGRIAKQHGFSKKTVQRIKSRIYEDPLSIFHLKVISHRGKGMYQCTFCGESKPRLSTAQRHALAHFFAHHIAQNIDLRDIPEVW